jgi:hypothetical protein
MTPALLGLWALGVVVLPGLLFSAKLIPSARLSFEERLGWSIALGSSALGVVGFSFFHVGAFGRWWIAWILLTLAASRRNSWKRSFQSPAGLFWTLFLMTVAVEIAMTRTTSVYAFGEDVYYWTGMARQVALRGGGDLVPAFTSPAPAGYGFLLATAASFVPRLHDDPVVVAMILFWSLFAACTAYALANRLAGAAVGAAVAVIYVGSYWTLYFLVPAVSRQAWALGLAPLVFLVLVRKGHRAFRSKELYLLLGAAWLLHAFTALILLCCLPPIVFQAGMRLGWRNLERELGRAGSVLTVALLAAPLVVLGRFFFGILGIVRFFDHPYFYVMKPMDSWELARTLGPGTLVLLALGALALRDGFAGARGRARLLGLWLLFLLVAIGTFHQTWYRSASLGLPPHRYYLFYSLVALSWSGALRLPRRFPSRSRVLAVAAIAAVSIAQLVFHAYFVRRMLTPLPNVRPVLEAAHWIESRTELDDTVVIALGAADRAAEVRYLLSPRPAVIWNPDEAPAIPEGATFLLTDRPPSGFSRSWPVRFETGSPSISVLEVLGVSSSP